MGIKTSPTTAIPYCLSEVCFPEVAIVHRHPLCLPHSMKGYVFWVCLVVIAMIAGAPDMALACDCGSVLTSALCLCAKAVTTKLVIAGKRILFSPEIVGKII